MGGRSRLVTSRRPGGKKAKSRFAADFGFPVGFIRDANQGIFSISSASGGASA